jgi:hypothetical protein
MIKILILMLMIPLSAWCQKEGIVIRHALIAPYTQVQYDYDGDSLRMNIYDFGTNTYRIVKSVDGKSWSNYRPIIGKVESAVRWTDFEPIWYELIHYFDNSNKQYFYKIGFSEDGGVTWQETPDTLNDGSKWFGEDHTVTYHPDSNKFYLFVRHESSYRNIFRKISLVKTDNYISFSKRKLMFPKDTNNFRNKYSKDYLKTFYSGTMFQTDTNEYWFLCNVYKIDKSLKGDLQSLADTTGLDNCVWSELMFSPDGDNWKRTNDTNAFIPINGGMRQVFTTPVVIGDTLFIYSFESRIPHISGNPESPDWNIYRYKISVKNLRWYKPA